ncbi:hypothetical protein ULVI_10555 [Cochleicola gelatinilyticus]|uniref:Uncharacterized protein n=1 Tax=Cochleicola gelatinilyticus TaxID=1763537 RepID=A0A167HAF9_9FLAO|nr:hypothetical protein ULVI_10555 [Cochleicola gelatinilyticus]
MKFTCEKCSKETEFNKSDYIGSGKNQNFNPIIKWETFNSPIMKKKEVIIKCSNCQEKNNITISYYEK